jgi:hypothetical protein
MLLTYKMFGHTGNNMNVNHKGAHAVEKVVSGHRMRIYQSYHVRYARCELEVHARSIIL